MWGLGILKGLWLTFKNMMRGPITLQYPKERAELPERSRWAVRPICEADGSPRCTACTNCVRACPDGILHLEVATREDKSKHIDSFTYEVGACMFCGLCVEACPFSALEMSKEYELATTEVCELERVLLADVDAAGPKRARPAEQPAQADQPADDAATKGEAKEVREDA